MRVDYHLCRQQYKSEWICLEHTGYPRQKARAWWRQRSLDPVPTKAARAVDIADGGGLAMTKTITVRSVAGEPYERIVDYELSPIPEPISADELQTYNPSDVPF